MDLYLYKKIKKIKTLQHEIEENNSPQDSRCCKIAKFNVSEEIVELKSAQSVELSTN